MPLEADTKAFSTLMHGLGEVERQLAAGGMGSEAGAILAEAAKPLLEDMQQQTVEDPKMISHDLHNSIKAYKKTKGPYKTAITIGVHRRDWHKEDYYPAYVEFGHGGPRPAGPHPYVRPAYDKHADEAYRIIREGLLGLLKELDK